MPGCGSTARKIIGSREIMRALDDAVPEPPLLPADEKERKSVGLAEEWGDEVLQPMARRIIWVALRRSPDSMASYGGDSSLPIPDAVTRLTAPLVARAEQKINDATDLNVRADLRALDQHLARVERWMDHDVVGGSAPNAADLQIGSGLALHPHGRATWRTPSARGARASSARRWFPDYPGRVPAGALPAEWFRERTAAG